MFVLDKAHHVPESSTEIVRTKMFGKPLEMTRKGWYKIPSGYTLRVNMTSDTFLEEADGWRTEMWRIIRQRPDVIFYILTKRVPRIMECLPEDWGEGYENVDLNMTCETQRAFDERWPIFRDIPARHKGINLAPMLSKIDITPALASGQIENVNLGGEGFGGDRPCHYEWIRRVSDDCTKYRVNFTVNAIGSHFVKDGRMYLIDSQQEQGRQAYRSGLSRFFGKPKYKLYHPVDGHLLEEGELMVPRFNIHRCLECTSAPLCVGCTDCGSCKQVELVSMEQLIEMREQDKK
jgi:protein gp37